MIRIQEEFLAKAAKHHLFVQFHGACKPSGLNRTYPNEFTREGTLNYEHCKWDKDTDADHDIHMPFTRLLAGATDYHLGGFRSLPRDKFKNQERNPYVMSTRCHMLAMYVVIDSNKLVKEVKEITYRDKITLPLASDGGSVFHIQPI